MSPLLPRGKNAARSVRFQALKGQEGGGVPPPLLTFNLRKITSTRDTANGK